MRNTARLSLALVLAISACGRGSDERPSPDVTGPAGADDDAGADARAKDPRADGTAPGEEPGELTNRAGTCAPAPRLVSADDVPHSEARDGTRLVGRYLRPEGGGDATFLGFFDTERNLPCKFQVASDCVYRCLPDVPGVFVRYGSADCAEPTLWWSLYALLDYYMPLPEAPPPFFTLLADVSCPVRMTVREVGASLGNGQGQPGFRADLVSGKCTGGAPEESTVHTRYALGKDDDITSWVEARLERVRVPGSQFEVDYFHGSDGSFLRAWVYDTTHGTLCAPNFQYDVCLPLTNIGTRNDTMDVASDSMCTQPAGWGSACEADTPFIGYGDTFYRRGALIDTPYAGTSFLCRPRDGQPYTPVAARYYALGEVLTAKDFSALPVVHKSTPRIVREQWKDAQGQLVGERGYYDNQFDGRCDPEPASDGVSRCLPSENWFNFSEYLDPACTDPLVQTDVPEGGVGYWTDGESSVRVYRVGPRMSAPDPVYRLENETCTARPRLAEYTGSRVVEIDPREFVPMVGP